jgi:hypothetical protein
VSTKRKYLEDIADLAEKKLTFEQQTDNYTQRKAKSYLFFDDNSRVEFLAQERFPNDPNAAEKYINIDGDLYYESSAGQKNYQGKNYAKEFPNNNAVNFFEDSIYPNIAPALTFTADVGGGMTGASFGFKRGLSSLANPANPFNKNPYTAAAYLLGATALGGFSGNYILGGAARTGREMVISQFYSLPPEEITAAHNDLLVSSAFSLIPFGKGAVGQAKVMEIFKNEPNALRYLINLRGETDEIIKEAKTLGFDLTPAQAGVIGNRGADIQYFLSRQPDARKITEFYDNQAMQIAETIEIFAEKIGSKQATTGDVNTRLVNASAEVLEELTKKRKQRATKLYNIIKEKPGGTKINTQSIIDLIDSKIAGEVLDSQGKLIREIRPDSSTIKNLEKFKKMFYDDDGNLIDDLMELDARRTTSMKKLATKLQKQATGDSGTIFGLIDDMTSLMDQAEPLYRNARRVYDPNKPPLQLIQKSAIGKFGKFMTDKQSANALKELFNPNLSVKSLRNSRRVLQAIDPELFKDVKKQFLLDQYDRFFKASALQKGLPNFQKYFEGKKVKSLMQEMLTPEEFDNFYRMNELFGKAFSIPTGGSVTQPLVEEGIKLAADSLGIKTKAGQMAFSLINFPGRFFSGRVGDEFLEKIAKKQNEGYLRLLTDQLIADPDTAKTLDKVYRFFNTNEFMLKQTGTRAAVGPEGFIPSIIEPPIQTFEPTSQRQKRIYENQIKSLSPNNDQAQLNEQTLSPIILPDEKDREIAMRQVEGGIGSLV